MWKEELEKIVQEKNIYGERVNNGISEDEARVFLKRVENELNISLPDEYIKILNNLNGIEFNGFILYGVDEQMLNTTPNQHVNGLIENNKIWYENKWQKKYIFLGESNISWYVYDLVKGTYYELDNPSGRESGEFDCFESLFEKILSDALK